MSAFRSGHHRLEAAKSLGWESLHGIIIEGDATAGRLAEIAENLHRAELTALERAEHVSEWVRLTDIPQLESDASVLRAVGKIQALRQA